MRVFSWDLRNRHCTKTNVMRLMINNDFLKIHSCLWLITPSDAAHFPAFKQTDAGDTEGYLDSKRSNGSLSFADSVIGVKVFIGTGHGD